MCFSFQKCLFASNAFKIYAVISEHAGGNYHLKAMIAMYLHLQTRSLVHVWSMVLTMHVYQKNFALHTEGIYCIIVFVWLLLFDDWCPVKVLACVSLHWLKMVFFIFQDLCHSHCDDAIVQRKITAIIDCFISSAIPPALQIDIPPEQAKKIVEHRKELGPYIFREAQVRSRVIGLARDWVPDFKKSSLLMWQLGLHTQAWAWRRKL